MSVNDVRMLPRVTGVERIVVRVPFRERVRPWNELLVGQWGVVEVLRVTTDSPGIVGWGETLLHYTWQRVTDAAIARVIGANPADLVWDDSLGAGLQLALLDILGKAVDAPAYRLIGQEKVRDWCPVAWWTTKAPPEVLAAEAVDALAEGYRSYKFKGRPFFDVFEQVEAVSAVTPADFGISIDWNGMLLTPGDAAPVLSELDENERMALYETPIRRSPEDLAYLRRQVSKPIAEHFSFADAASMLRLGAVDGFVIIAPGLVRQALAVAPFNKPFFLQIVGTGITTAYALHFGAVLAGATQPAVTAMNIYVDDLVVDPIVVSGGYARVPEAPGLGIEVDEDALERYRMEPPYEVSYPRTILSFHLGGHRVRHYAGIHQLLDECGSNVAGRDIAVGLPVQARGARLEIRHDDGGAEFDELHRRAEQTPVWDVRQ